MEEGRLARARAMKIELKPESTWPSGRARGFEIGIHAGQDESNHALRIGPGVTPPEFHAPACCPDQRWRLLGLTGVGIGMLGAMAVRARSTTDRVM
jgi:hypothetical protein